MPHKVNRNTDAQYNYIKANYRQIYVREQDHRNLKKLAGRIGIPMVRLVTAFLDVDEQVLLEALSRTGDKQ